MVGFADVYQREGVSLRESVYRVDKALTASEAPLKIGGGGARTVRQGLVDIYPDYPYIPEYPKGGLTDMIRVSSTEFGKELGRYQDLALSQPVIVTRNGRDRTVVISADEYQRLKRRDRQVFAAGELPQEMIDAVSRAEMDPRHRHLDDLLTDWTP